MNTQQEPSREHREAEHPEHPPQSAHNESVGSEATSSSPIPASKGFMTANIAVLSIVGLVSILIMLFGDFEGKGVRVFSTLLLFAAFTGFSAYDGRKRARPQYIQIAMVGNIYLVALGLMLIWGTMALERWYWADEIVFRLIALIILVRVGMFLVQITAKFADAPEQGLRTAGSVAALALAVTMVLYSLPLALDPFFTFADFYWRVSVAMLLFSALAISVGILLYWANREPREKRVPHAGTQNPGVLQQLQEAEDTKAQMDAAKRQEEGISPSNAQVAQEPQFALQGPENGAQAYARPVAALAPWPVFPNGQPLPALTNGRPDYHALQYMASVFIESERQWFSGK